MNTVKLSVKELTKLMDWLAEKDLVNTKYIVRIETSNVSGIGSAVTAYVDLTENEGIYKDLTDYENW